MKKTNVSIANKDFANRLELYLKDPKSDFFVILKQKIYPLHKSFLADLQYFNSSNLESKMQMIDADLDPKYFQAVIGYYYGKQLQFQRDWGILKLLDVIKLLNNPELLKKITKDLQINFDDYGFFLLMSIGQRFKIKWLQEKCEEELVLMGFQQINFNRYDLLQVDKEMLTEIIKLHELLRINQNITGLKLNQLKKIIKEYCTTNKLGDVDFNVICSYLITDAANPGSMQKTTDLSRKKSQPGKQNDLKQSKNLKQMTISQKKNQQVRDLHQINTKIQQMNSEMMKVMSNVKTNIQDSVKLQKAKAENNQDNIEEKFKKFERTCQQQDAKYLSLKAEMEKLSPSQLRNEEQNSQSMKNIGSSTSSTKENDQKGPRSRKLSETFGSSMFSNMPRLSRDLD